MLINLSCMIVNIMVMIDLEKILDFEISPKFSSIAAAGSHVYGIYSDTHFWVFENGKFQDKVDFSSEQRKADRLFGCGVAANDDNVFVAVQKCFNPRLKQDYQITYILVYGCNGLERKYRLPKDVVVTGMAANSKGLFVASQDGNVRFFDDDGEKLFHVYGSSPGAMCTFRDKIFFEDNGAVKSFLDSDMPQQYVKDEVNFGVPIAKIAALRNVVFGSTRDCDKLYCSINGQIVDAHIPKEDDFGAVAVSRDVLFVQHMDTICSYRIRRAVDVPVVVRRKD